MKRSLLIIKLYLYSILGKNKKKAELIKRSKLFKQFGDSNYWQPNWIPSHPELISIGNNVNVCAEVRFYEHDIIHCLWMENSEYQGPQLGYYTGEIVVGDNVVICANSIILYNVHIGNNCIISAGSVVTKDVPDFSIVGGNPAKIIGNTKDLLKKRLKFSGKDVEKYNYSEYFKS